MKPLSHRTRITYLLLFGVLFVVLIPFAILYATGYRFNFLSGNFTLIPTGGVYISVPKTGALVSINGKDEGVSSLFTRNFYVDNLEPGTYAVHVAHEGSYPWYKTLVVEPRVVTDARAFLVPQQLETVRLMRASTTTASTTRGVSATQFDAYMALFVATSTERGGVLPLIRPGATTTSKGITVTRPPEDSSGGYELYIEEGNVRLHWAQSTTSIPSNLCTKPSVCVRDYLAEKGPETAIKAVFFDGGILYATKEKGVYLSEADVRPTPLIIPIYPRRGAEFRIANGTIIIKDGNALYEIVGF